MKKISVIILAILVLTFDSCKSWNKTKKGAAIGAGTGAVVGGAIGKAAHNNTILGAIIGAAVGGVAGGAIGRYMDKQAEEIQRDIKDAKVERVGEGIKITFNSGILYDLNSAELKPEAVKNVGELAKILNKYPDTEILIEGHTDSTGTDKINNELSERRAQSVANELKAQNIKGGRMTTKGYGSKQPIESNKTPEGRAQNRRVDIAIMADKKLKKAAEKGEIK